MPWHRRVWWALLGRDLEVRSVAYREGWTACERTYQARVARLEAEIAALSELVTRAGSRAIKPRRV